MGLGFMDIKFLHFVCNWTHTFIQEEFEQYRHYLVQVLYPGLKYPSPWLDPKRYKTCDKKTCRVLVQERWLCVNYAILGLPHTMIGKHHLFQMSSFVPSLEMQAQVVRITWCLCKECIRWYVCCLFVVFIDLENIVYWGTSGPLILWVLFFCVGTKICIVVLWSHNCSLIFKFVFYQSF